MMEYQYKEKQTAKYNEDAKEYIHFIFGIKTNTNENLSSGLLKRRRQFQSLPLCIDHVDDVDPVIHFTEKERR